MDWSTIANAGSFGKGLATGVGEGAVSLAEGVWSLAKGSVQAGSQFATDAEYRAATYERAKQGAQSAAQYGVRFMDDPVTRSEAYEQVQRAAASLKQKYDEAHEAAAHKGQLAEFYGRVAGRGGFEVGTFLVPAAKLGALGKAGKATGAANLGKVAKVGQGMAHAPAGQAVRACVATAPLHKVLQVRSAESVNYAMIAQGNLPAWKSGTQVVTEVAPKGTRFQMVVSRKQAERLMRDDKDKDAFGRFGTTASIASGRDARRNLAILKEFKSDVSRVVTVETTEDVVVHRGTVGRIGKKRGGAEQVQFDKKGGLKLVGDPVVLPHD